MRSVFAGVAALGVATFAIGTPAAFAATSLTNGTFEAGNYADPYGFGFETLSSANSTATAITGWTVTSGSVDWIGTYWQQPAGVTKSIDMNGSPGYGQPPAGTLSQTLSTDLNATYVVHFQLAGNPACGPDLKQLTVTAGNATPQTYTADTTNTSITNMDWQPASYSFTATSTTTPLTFAADPTNTSNCGAALADVTLTETAATGAQCKDGGWQAMTRPDGTPFKNQGDCVSFYATSGQTPIGR